MQTPSLTREVSEPQTAGSGGVFRRSMTVRLTWFYTVCKLLQFTLLEVHIFCSMDLLSDSSALTDSVGVTIVLLILPS